MPRLRFPPNATPALARLRALLLTGVWLLLTVGCRPSGDKAELTIINGPELESLDPAVVTGQADGRAALSLYEGLTRYDPVQGLAQPGYAERWEISPDGLLYTFHLRANARWSTGEPITAEDFLYSWLRVLDPAFASEYSGLLYYVENGEDYGTGKLKDPAKVGLRVLDPHTFQVRLAAPTLFFLELCAYPTLAVVPRRAIARYGDDWMKHSPVPASGAFELVEWRLNDRIRLRRNPRYWDAASVSLNTVDLLPCTSPPTALNLYEAGQADIVWDKELIPAELVDLLRQRPDFHRFDYFGTYFYRYNVTRKPLDDPRVRQALAMAVDRQRIVAKITRAGEKFTAHYVPDGLPSYTSPPGLGYDPAAARALLASAGFEGGRGFPRLEYLYDNMGRAHEQIAVEMREMWARELGIVVDLKKLEWKTYLQAQGRLEYDLCRSSWIGDYNDPNTFLDMFMSNNGNNRTGWKSAAYDRLMREANVQTDVARRASLLQRAESLLIREEAPIVPIYFYSGLEYYDTNRVAGVYSNMRSEHPLRAIHRIGPPRR